MIAVDQNTGQTVHFRSDFVNKVLGILDKLDKEELQQLRAENPEPIKMFSDEEESVLWRCMNDKICPELCSKLTNIIDDNSEEYKFDLYRGVSNSLLRQLQNRDVGEKIMLNRVTSFSEDFNIARQFASYEVYGTKVVLQVVGPVQAFPYSKHMQQILLAAPDSEFHGVNKDKHRKDNIDMVMNEQEWMINECTMLKIIDIIDDEETGMCIYKTEIC